MHKRSSNSLLGIAHLSLTQKFVGFIPIAAKCGNKNLLKISVSENNFMFWEDFPTFLTAPMSVCTLLFPVHSQLAWHLSTKLGHKNQTNSPQTLVLMPQSFSTPQQLGKPSYSWYKVTGLKFPGTKHF